MTRRGTDLGRVIGLAGSALDRLMPLHLWIGPTGHVLRVGPTLAKLLVLPPGPPRVFTDMVSFRWPRGVGGLPDLLLLEGVSLTASPVADPDITLRGQIVSLPAGSGALLNFSLGVSLTDAVQRHGLTLGDFAPSDLAPELLFLVEANAMVRAASHDLTTRLQDAQRAAEEQALTDPLTGLRNRRAMDRALDALTDDRAQDAGFGLMRLDLDHFKAVNDQLGHDAGDQVLQHVARILSEETRSHDLVARVGGDEFVLILRDCRDLDLLGRIAGRILERLQAPILVGGQVARVSASIGTILSSDYTPPEVDRMLSDADDATYRSKRAGRARHTVFRPAPALAAKDPARLSPGHH